jgi:hypothetical protein
VQLHHLSCATCAGRYGNVVRPHMILTQTELGYNPGRGKNMGDS